MIDIQIWYASWGKETFSLSCFIQFLSVGLWCIVLSSLLFSCSLLFSNVMVYDTVCLKFLTSFAFYCCLIICNCNAFFIKFLMVWQSLQLESHCSSSFLPYICCLCGYWLRSSFRHWQNVQRNASQEKVLLQLVLTCFTSWSQRWVEFLHWKLHGLSISSLCFDVHCFVE